MDLSSSTASALARPRIILAFVTAAAAASVGIYFFREARSAAAHGHGHGHGQGLHRSNAIRRPRRRSTVSTASSAESRVDENDLTTVRPQTDGAETVAEETVDENWWDDGRQMPRAGQNIVSLLFRVSEDNARRNAYVHRGCACNACGIVPIRGIRYRCANCADFDLCETCEAQGMHIKTHIFYKVKVPAPPFGPRQMQPVWYPGDPDTCIRTLPRQTMVKLSRDTGFERPELEAFWEQWTYMANTEWREDPYDLGVAMDRKTFERCLVPSGGYRHTAPNLIHDRMFSFYDTNNDDLIGFAEFLHGLSYRKRKDKLKKIFEGYDVDGDGFVNRRDFLRIFRAYYVLYKQMHKDILEGLDDQVMSSTEAHQLVSSRQPLSSLFGREGRVPQADHGRPMDDKVFHSNGDVVVTDEGTGAVGEDRQDTSGRDEILTSLFSRSSTHDELYAENSLSSTSGHHPQSPAAETEARYWDALLNPPATVQELPALLMGTGGPRILQEVLASIEDEEAEEEEEDEDEEEEEEGEGEGERAGEAAQLNGTEAGAANQQGAGDGQATASAQADGESAAASTTASQTRPGMIEAYLDRVPNASQLHARHQAILAHRHHTQMTRAQQNRRAVRRKLHERWKRRQFYLDEEEGARPPNGWEEDEDVLARMNGIAESSKAAAAQHQPALSPRSRSSSKVRFAEDTDDYEVRSNPSTSSRSVPERWGGMDIPDAERDAGKEILYQVTQQAFNELLDRLFKDKEDLAIRAAETKEARDKHRPLFEAIDVNAEDKAEADLASSSRVAPADASIKPIADQTLEELLASTGYTIDEVPEEEKAAEAAEMQAVEDLLRENENENENEDEDEDEAEVGTTAATVATSVSTGTPEFSQEIVEYRDPTMPQFRPNSEATSSASMSEPAAAPATPSVFESSSSASSDSNKMAGRARAKEKQRGGKAAAAAGGTADNETTPTPIPRSTLVEWKRLDLAEQEARERGGWGKLSYDEFETIYKVEEARANRLDYLGSWIDFCIP